MLISIPQVLECYHVAGGDSFVIKLVAASLAQLEEIIGKLSPYGQTITSIVLSTVLERDMPLPPFAGSGSLS
jgi:Lrp/AsnC family leucine-responsive transcriptional regulator